MTRPFISIVVPAASKASTLERTLSALLLSVRASRWQFEVIVVGTEERGVRVGFPQVSFLRNDRGEGKIHARNIGAEAAHGRILIFVDDGLIVREEFVAKLGRWFVPSHDRARKRVFAVGAQVATWYEGLPLQRCTGGVWSGGRLTPAFREAKEPARCLFVQAIAAAYDRRMLVKLGGFPCLYDSGLWPDYDVCWRAARRGAQLMYDPQAFAAWIGGEPIDLAQEITRAARNHFLFEWANLRSPRMVAEWTARLPLQFAREMAKPPGHRLFTNAVHDALPRLREATRRRFADRGALRDEDLLEPFRDFVPDS